MEEVASIAVGFVLTTLIGGWWAGRLQHRSWERQNEMRIREEERRRAAEVCDDLTRLLDKRLYRMRRVYWAVAAAIRGDGGLDTLELRLADYNAVLYEWNDRLNANLALIGSHFGTAASDYLFDLYEDFRAVGRDLEAAVSSTRQSKTVTIDLDNLDRQFEGWAKGSLNGRVFLLGSAMTAQLRDGLVGRCAPQRTTIPTLSSETQHVA